MKASAGGKKQGTLSFNPKGLILNKIIDSTIGCI